MAHVISFSRFTAARLQRESVLAEQRGKLSPEQRKHGNPYYGIDGLPEQRAKVLPFLRESAVKKEVDASVGKLSEGPRQVPVAELYAGKVPLVGSLSQILEAFGECQSLGIRCGLTRLRKGVWQLAPRSVMA